MLRTHRLAVRAGESSDSLNEPVQSLNQRGITMNTVYRPTTLAVVLSIVATLGFIIFAGVQQADAHQPYGGCKEGWRYSISPAPGVNHCRSHSWVIRPRFVIRPSDGRVLVNRLPACEYEDSNGCYWDAKRFGNGRGDSFIAGPKGRVFYVSGFAR